MFCTRCGQSVTPGAVFCSRCGQPLAGPADFAQMPPVMPTAGWPPPSPPPIISGPNVPPPQGYAAPLPQGYSVPQQGYIVPSAKKKKTGMVVGLVAGAVALIAIVVVLLFVWPGFLITSQSVAGVWYSEKRGEVIQFGSGHSFDAQTNYGDFDGDYSFDVKSGKGHIEMEDGREFDFLVDRDQLLVYNMGAFERADDGFNVDDFIENAKDS